LSFRVVHTSLFWCSWFSYEKLKPSSFGQLFQLAFNNWFQTWNVDSDESIPSFICQFMCVTVVESLIAFAGINQPCDCSLHKQDVVFFFPLFFFFFCWPSTLSVRIN
jgi:hypothetical protein